MKHVPALCIGGVAMVVLYPGHASLTESANLSLASASAAPIGSPADEREPLHATVRVADHLDGTALIFELPDDLPPETKQVIVTVDDRIVLEATGYLGGGFGWVVDDTVDGTAEVSVMATTTEAAVLAETRTTLTFEPAS